MLREGNRGLNAQNLADAILICEWLLIIIVDFRTNCLVVITTNQ